MALQGSYTDEAGDTHANAYAIVAEINANWQNQTAHVTVMIFHRQSAWQNGKKPVVSIYYDFYPAEQVDPETQEVIRPAFNDLFATNKLDAKNPVKVSYEYIGTLAEWAGWVTV